MSTFRCRMPYCTGETWQIRGVCDDCFLHRIDQLRGMGDLYARCYAQLVPGARIVAAERVRLPSPTGAVPLNIGVYDAMEYAAQVIGTWANLARPSRTHAYVKSWSGALFVANVKLLLRSDHRIVTSYVGPDYIHDVHSVYRRMVQIANPCESRRLTRPCPMCDNVSILARNAGEYAVCLTCGARWSHSQLLILEQQAHRIAS